MPDRMTSTGELQTTRARFEWPVSADTPSFPQSLTMSYERLVFKVVAVKVPKIAEDLQMNRMLHDKMAFVRVKIQKGDHSFVAEASADEPVFLICPRPQDVEQARMFRLSNGVEYNIDEGKILSINHINQDGTMMVLVKFGGEVFDLWNLLCCASSQEEVAGHKVQMN